MPVQQWEYSLRQAAQVCAVSIDTIKRRLRAGDLPHARQLNDPAHTWVVPLGDLVHAGFTISPSKSREIPGAQRSGIPAVPPPYNLRSDDLAIRVAVAEAVRDVHAFYAEAFCRLASDLGCARGGDRIDTDPQRSEGSAPEAEMLPLSGVTVDDLFSQVRRRSGSSVHLSSGRSRSEAG